MLVASMIVKVIPEHAEDIEAYLNTIPSITTYGIHKTDNIIAVAEAQTVQEIEELSSNLMKKHEAVLGVYPTYLTVDDDE
ncbi:MAG: chaperone NapD [bacterium]|nr:chaperone NapD [bacterium]